MPLPERAFNQNFMGNGNGGQIALISAPARDFALAFLRTSRQELLTPTSPP